MNIFTQGSIDRMKREIRIINFKLIHSLLVFDLGSIKTFHNQKQNLKLSIELNKYFNKE